jgi:hypothetical protein
VALQPVNGKHVQIALEEVDTANFEYFGQAFYGALIGQQFVPLGGMHDGGGEGYFEPELYEEPRATHFLQVSKQETAVRKIRLTVARLRKFGRTPMALTYLTSQTIQDLDVVEDNLSEELSCRIRIRDGKYIGTQINNSDATIAAFEAYLRPALAHLGPPGASPIGTQGGVHADRTLAVFLRQEVEHRQGKSDLLESVADSLIIWALSETDPDAGRFMDRDAILTQIEQALPTAKQFMRGVLDVRLAFLRTRMGGEDRKIRFYSNDAKYCLPYETRELVKAENIEDASLKLDVSEIFERRCRTLAADDEERAQAPAVVRLCHLTLERVFERQGLQIAQFAHSGEESDELYEDVAAVVADLVAHDETLDDRAITRRLVLAVLRGTFYDATPEERSYLQKLSHTYVLLLLLKNEPKIVEYFKSLSSKFVLYIGTDFLVRALAEHYLAPENQTTRNLFAILKAAGSTLILTEKAVEELASHLRAQIFEFHNIYEHVENKVTLEAVEYIDRLIIRAYFYARLAPLGTIKAPTGWKSYIGQFASFDDIRNERGDQELARYLINKFGFVYETTAEMRRGLSDPDIQSLANNIQRVRAEDPWRRKGEKDDILAYNDALQVLRVYERRREAKEESPANPFGFKTWWLTQDAKVRRAAGPLIAKHHGQRFMMRPEFLLNFVSFAPSAREVVESYRTVFPTVLGIRLSNRVHDHTFREVMGQANVLWAVDEARAASMITSCINSLKGDMVKIYENKW